MKFINWLAQYNKALVPLVMSLIYFLNTYYGIEIPLDETSVMILFGVITSLLTWLVPNKKTEKEE